jgi:hypothetical protein
MSTLTIAQVAAQAGDRNATLANAGHLPVTVETAGGKTRNVSGSGFGSGLVLYTGHEDNRTLTVREVVVNAGGDASSSLTSYGEARVTVVTRTGKTRPVTGARFTGSGVTLVTGK